MAYSANSSNSAEGSDPGETTKRAGVEMLLSEAEMDVNEKGLPLIDEIYKAEHTKSLSAV